MKNKPRKSYGEDTTAMYCKDVKGNTLRVGDNVITSGGGCGYKINKIIFNEGEPMLELARLSYREASSCLIKSVYDKEGWVRNH